MAELHYKLALAQQFLELPEAALASVRAAIGILEKILTGLKPAEAEPASFSFGVPEVDANVEAADAPAQPLDPKVTGGIQNLPIFSWPCFPVSHAYSSDFLPSFLISIHQAGGSCPRLR